MPGSDFSPHAIPTGVDPFTIPREAGLDLAEITEHTHPTRIFSRPFFNFAAKKNWRQ